MQYKPVNYINAV